MDNAALQLELMRVLQRFRSLHPFESTMDLPKGAFFMLEMLDGHQRQYPHAQGMYVSDLARRMHMSPQALSRVMKIVEGKGGVERTVDSADRRNTFIRLTETGEALHHAQRARMLAFMDRVITAMGQENMEQLLLQWNRLIDTIESEAQKMREGEP